MTYLTSREVASILGVSQRTVSRRVKKGDLKYQKRKGRLYFPKDQFQEAKETKETTDNLQGVLQAIQKQLEEKDKQIDRLQKLLENQQILAKDLQDKFLMLPETTQKPKTKPKRRNTGNSKKRVVKKQGFWNNLFR